jgi:ribosomal protein S18 acetylase RimI-like enzyme
LKLRLCDKSEEDYALFSKGFYEIFEPKYFIDQNKVNPFKAKDNIYIYAETNAGAFMGALNLVFLTENAFEILKQGNVQDDMFLETYDIAPLHADAVNTTSPVYAYFSTIYVKKQYRGQGAAQALMRYALVWLQNAAKQRKIHCLGYCLNDASRALFETAGMKVIGKNLNDEWILSGEYPLG